MPIHDRDLLTGRDKVETAVARLHQYCDGKKVLCAFSGGKDSQCVYHLLKLAGIPFEAQYSVTRFEPPELISFIRENYPDVAFRRAYKRDLVAEIGDIGLPNRWFRWCCDCKHRKTPGFDIACIGIRWAESARRRARWTSFGRKQDGTFYCCPVVDWTDEDVWEFLGELGVPHCSLYDEGFKRIGCVCCPLSPGNMRRNAERWPKIANVLWLGHKANWGKAIAAGGVTSRGKWYKMLAHGTARAAFEYWLDHGMMVKSDGDDAQDNELPCLFAGSGFSESDGVKEDE